MDDRDARSALIGESRIFITCPGGAVTGGPELLHQLTSLLARSGRKAYIVYTPVGRRWTTPTAYERYACPVASAIPDEPDVAVIVPEVGTPLLLGLRNARRVVWWLSVDNYVGGFRGMDAVLSLARRLLRGRIDSGTTHLFQSAYARDFVTARFGGPGAMLSDYLAAEYLAFGSPQPRRDVVAFNPRKGRNVTRRLIRALPSMQFLALEKMSRAQVREALGSCKVYVDFGGHPGKDRLPREAAACGALVLVGRKGSAANAEDVPLPGDYKLDPAAPPAEVGALIVDCFKRFEWHAARQRDFRAGIRAEPALFVQQATQVFGLDPADVGEPLP